MNQRLAAVAVAALAFAAGIVFERFLVNVGAERHVLIPGLADFSPIFNKGVSFGLFAPDSATGRHLLMMFLSVLSAAVAVFMWRATHRLAAMGFALVLAGALGNLSDRLQFNGAVFDFLALHLGRLPLFVCNLADIFISAGAALLLLDSLFPQGRGAPDIAA